MKSDGAKLIVVGGVLAVLLGAFLIFNAANAVTHAVQATTSPKPSAQTVMVAVSPTPVVSFTEGEVYNEDGVVITLSNPKGIDSFDIRVENHSDISISCSIINLAVNNFHVTETASFENNMSVLPGRAAERTCLFKGLSITDATTIESVDMELWIYRENGSDYNSMDIYIAHAETSMYEGYPTSYTVSTAKTVYDDENVSIYEWHDGTDIQDVYLIYQNKTDKCLDVRFDDSVVNGVMASGWYNTGVDLLPYCCYDPRHPTGSVMLWSAFNDTVAEKGINPVQEIIVKFRIQPEGGSSYTTDEITVYSVEEN